MDSGNSSSVQSSSGGDEDAETISTFLGPHGSLTSFPHATSLRHHHPSPFPSTFFDPLSTYLDAFTRSPPPPANSDSLLHLDMPWAAGNLRALSQPSCTDVGGGLLGSALPPRDSPAGDRGSGSRGHYAGSTTINPSPSSSPLHHPSLAPPSDPPPNASAAAPPRSSRKRSRASRRAPTTVLTTDTSNFRAMVQEFTGIPSPPFPSSALSPFPPRARLDLFHSTASPAARPPHSLLRPFPQKVTVPSFGPFAPGSSSSSPTISTTVSAAPTTSRTNADGLMRPFATNPTAANEPNTSISTSTTSILSSSYQLPSLGHQQHSLLNMFNFQSLQSSSPSTIRYNSLDAAMLGAVTSSQEPGGVMHPAVTYALGRGLGPASEGMPSSRGGGGGGDDLLRWVEGSSGSEGGG